MTSPVAFREIIPGTIAEQTTRFLKFRIEGSGGTALGSGDLDSLTLTLHNADGQIVNSRDGVSILNQNGGIVLPTGQTLDSITGEPADADRNCMFELTPADTAIINPTRREEPRTALLEFTYNSGSRAGAKEIVFTVANLEKR